MEKFYLQLKRLVILQETTSPPSANFDNIPLFYNDVTLRLNALGIDFGSAARNAFDGNSHFNWAKDPIPNKNMLWVETGNRIEKIFTALSLLTMEDQWQEQNPLPDIRYTR